MKRRINLSCAMIHDPPVVFMDEPTVGVDPQSRNHIFESIESLQREGRTILYTTHYMEEAQRLCDRVAIMDRGKLIALGTPRELVDRSGHGTRLEVRLAKPVPAARLKELEAVQDCRETDGTYFLHAQPAAQAIAALVRFLEADGNALKDLHMAQPSLEDVFIEVTGRRLTE